MNAGDIAPRFQRMIKESAVTLALQGIGAARGVVAGPAYMPPSAPAQVREYALAPASIEQECLRYRHAVEKARAQLCELRTRIPAGLPVDIVAFVEVHLLMLEDKAFSEEPLRYIEQHYRNAEWALSVQRDVLVEAFEGMEDPYLRARKEDVEHVARRILNALREQQASDMASGVGGAVVFADDLEPTEVVLMYHQGAAALVTSYGGYTSHAAILARGLGLAMVTGVRGVRDFIIPGEAVVVDGERGIVLVGDDDYVRSYCERRHREERAHHQALAKLRKRPAVTRDGAPISLQANIELPEDLPGLSHSGAVGVGLYRTEFLFLNRETPPDEDEQFAAYHRVLTALKGAPVTIRTVDLGGDKPWSGLHPPSVGANPALGLRGIRHCLRFPELFRTQLRAILRTSAYGAVRLMVPMLATLTELRQVMHLIEEAKQELRAEGLQYDENMAVGAMIEVPAAALSVDVFARHLRFVSIGTNDLIQYAVATDRLDDEVNYLYDPLHPGVLRLIQNVINTARAHAVPVAMCGEMAGDTRYTRLLLGMGLRDFSMHASSVPEVKRVIQESSVVPLARVTRRILRSSDPDEIADLVQKLNAD